LSSQSTPTVWVAELVVGQQNQYTVHEVALKTGMRNGAVIEILDGLHAGQVVVTAGQDYLKDDDTVTGTSADDATGSMAGGAR